MESQPTPKTARSIRWWPAFLVIAETVGVLIWIRVQDNWSFQEKNLASVKAWLVGIVLLLIWWSFFSRAQGRLRLTTTFALIASGLIFAGLFRIKGMSGDLLPIFEFRWARAPEFTQPSTNAALSLVLNSTNDFPQFLGPNRDGVFPARNLETNWSANPPKVVWRRDVGPAWSGFAMVGEICITHEQRGEFETVAAYKLADGSPLWTHADATRYDTVVGGVGPRDVPTVVSNRVYTCGATGWLNCLDLLTGRSIWQKKLLADGGKVPDWGMATSPLYADGLIIAHGGEGSKHSLYAFRATDGEPVWSAGNVDASYASPAVATLAGIKQILSFNEGTVSGHDVGTGRTFWEKPFGTGYPACAAPVVVSTNKVLFSRGYGGGSVLFEISRTNETDAAAALLWKSIRMKSKFAHLYAKNGFLYGLDDGILACVDLKDGSLRWKEGRYGHGQGLAIGEYYLLMSEGGELVLLRPTPDAPNELGRHQVLSGKTWNPIALAGDLLLVRNDQEAVCLRLH